MANERIMLGVEHTAVEAIIIRLEGMNRTIRQPAYVDTCGKKDKRRRKMLSCSAICTSSNHFRCIVPPMSRVPLKQSPCHHVQAS